MEAQNTWKMHLAEKHYIYKSSQLSGLQTIKHHPTAYQLLIVFIII